MPGLEKTIIDGTYKVTLKHWEILEYRIDRRIPGDEFVRVELGGFQAEQDYIDGAHPIWIYPIVIPLEEPNGGDDFTSLRSAIVSRVDDNMADVKKLAKKVAAFDGATEK